ADASCFGTDVAYLGDVRVAGEQVEFIEQRVVQGRLPLLTDARLGVVQVAEHDGVGRAGRLAGSDDFTVADGAAFIAGGDAGGADALRAVRALLHDAAAAHDRVGVRGHRQFGGRVAQLRVLQVVETAHLEGAVVRAVTGADAAVVHHHVQAFVVVHGG